MEEVIHYLELKNQYYEKFYTMTARFLDEIVQDRWDSMALVIDNRERILNIIRSFDMRIATLFEKLNLPPSQIDTYRPRVKALMDKRSEWVDRIVKLDLELMGKIEDVKTETIRELKRTLETGQQISSFEETAMPQRSSKPVKEV